MVAWSRIFDDREVVMAINTDSYNPRSAWVTIDNGLHSDNGRLQCVYSTVEDQLDQQLNIENRNGKAVYLTVPPAGFVIVK